MLITVVQISASAQFSFEAICKFSTAVLSSSAQYNLLFRTIKTLWYRRQTPYPHSNLSFNEKEVNLPRSASLNNYRYRGHTNIGSQLISFQHNITQNRVGILTLAHENIICRVHFITSHNSYWTSRSIGYHSCFIFRMFRIQISAWRPTALTGFSRFHSIPPGKFWYNTLN
jgi:hypothetical protein